MVVRRAANVTAAGTAFPPGPGLGERPRTGGADGGRAVDVVVFWGWAQFGTHRCGGWRGRVGVLRLLLGRSAVSGPKKRGAWSGGGALGSLQGNARWDDGVGDWECRSDGMDRVKKRKGSKKWKR